MTAVSRRLPIFLLVFLIVTWGTCPCVFAKMLGIEGGETTATQGGTQVESTAPCWGTAPAPSAPESEHPSKKPGDDCPCCQRGGWIRDLPPQVHALTLEQAAPAFLDWPQLALDALVALPERTECASTTHAPPDDRRLHAAPTGIVRLLT